MKAAKIQSTTLLLDANNSPLALGLEEEHLEPSSNAQDKKKLLLEGPPQCPNNKR